jgi:hypothetical protein
MDQDTLSEAEVFAPGQEFESMVESVLRLLQSLHPGVAEVRRHPHLSLYNSVEIIPDFELVYRLPHQVERRLIECQDRDTITHDIVRKIKDARTLSDRNRFIFVYSDRSALSDAVRRDLDSAGIVHYDFADFVAMIFQLNRTLEATGTATVVLSPKEQILADLNRAYEDIREQARKLIALISESNPSRTELELMFINETEPRKVPNLQGSPKSVIFMIELMRFSRKKKRLGLKFCEDVSSRIETVSAREECYVF